MLNNSTIFYIENILVVMAEMLAYWPMVCAAQVQVPHKHKNFEGKNHQELVTISQNVSNCQLSFWSSG